MKMIETIAQWVNKRSSFYFFLPDGPYGRPFDNQYSIERVEITPSGFSIHLSGDLTIAFTGSVEVVDEGCNLIVRGFELCEFLEQSSIKGEYDYGEVVLNGF